jgi:HrpA-like RNA helicase
VAIVGVEGRMYPVGTSSFSLSLLVCVDSLCADALFLQQPCPDYMVAAAETVLKIHRLEDTGDVLVFMPGQDEIERTIELIKETVQCATGEDGEEIKGGV